MVAHQKALLLIGPYSYGEPAARAVFKQANIVTDPLRHPASNQSGLTATGGLSTWENCRRVLTEMMCSFTIV